VVEVLEVIEVSKREAFQEEGSLEAIETRLQEGGFRSDRSSAQEGGFRSRNATQEEPGSSQRGGIRQKIHLDHLRLIMMSVQQVVHLIDTKTRRPKKKLICFC
jgi:hypothetical protein